MAFPRAFGHSALGASGTSGAPPGASQLAATYSDTNVLGGSGAAIHTLFKANDTANFTQTTRIASRSYAGTSPHTAILTAQSAGSSTLWIGGGSSVMAAIQNGRLRAQSGAGASSGVDKLWWNQNGVNLGTNPAAPVSGRAFQVSTTAFANAFNVDNATGHAYLPNDGQRLRLGASSDLSIYHTGTSSYVLNGTGGGTMWIYQEANANLRLRCVNASGGDLLFETRGANERARFNGEAGINLAAASLSDISTAGQLCIDADSDDLIFVSSLGNKIRLTGFLAY